MSGVVPRGEKRRCAHCLSTSRNARQSTHLPTSRADQAATVLARAGDDHRPTPASRTNQQAGRAIRNQSVAKPEHAAGERVCPGDRNCEKLASGLQEQPSAPSNARIQIGGIDSVRRGATSRVASARRGSNLEQNGDDSLGVDVADQGVDEHRSLTRRGADVDRSAGGEQNAKTSGAPERSRDFKHRNDGAGGRVADRDWPARALIGPEAPKDGQAGQVSTREPTGRCRCPQPRRKWER